jgi:hypothetical protein
VLHQLNPVLRGWTAYFRHGVSSATFQYLSAFIWRQVFGWLRRKKQLAGGRVDFEYAYFLVHHRRDAALPEAVNVGELQ